MILKVVISEVGFAEIALELSPIEPGHHDAVDLIMEAFCFGAKWALVANSDHRPLPPLG